LLLVVEEAEIYISPGERSNAFLNLVNYGRHYNVSILGIARRATELSRQFRAMCQRYISFKQTDVVDLQLMEKMGLSDLDKLSDHEYKEIIT
jgi:hypothetical protein